MKRKSLRVLSIILSASMILSTSLQSNAYELDANKNSVEKLEYQNNEDEDFTNDVNVYAELASVYKVTIPKYIVLSGVSKKANYKVKVDGDIAGYENITVIPNEKVNLYSKNKNMQIGSVKQDKTVWQIDNFDTNANGSIYANNLTAGKWSGLFNFNINLTTDKVLGDIILPEDQWSDEEVNISLKLGESKLVKTFGNVKLLSSNNDVVSVEGNKLNALKVGESKVTLTNENASNNQILNVEVTKAINDVHIHTAGNIVKENEVKATCETAGSYDEVTYCITCKEELSRVTKTIEATGHTLASKIVEDTNATCVKEGVHKEQDYCTVCGKEFEVKTTTIQALGHKYDEGKITDNSTCTKEGVKTYTCTVCGDTKTEAISKASHTEGSFVTTKQPTCEEKGIQTKSCTVCGAVLEEKEIAATGHTAKTAVQENKKDATCTTKGSVDSVVYCAICNKELSRTTTQLNALGHNWELSISNDATCELDSLEAYKCSRCSETKITHDKKATGHVADTSKDKVIAATCTAQGYTTHICKNCSKTYSDTYKNALGHKYNSEGTCQNCGNFDISKLAPGLYTMSTANGKTTYTTKYTWQQMLDKGIFTVDKDGYIEVCEMSVTTGYSKYASEFENCFLVLDDSVKKVARNSFMSCVKLKGFYISKNVNYFETSWANKSVSEIYLDAENPYFTLENGILYSKDKTKLWYAVKDRTGSISIAPECTTIWKYAFAWSSYDTVTIPESITYIEAEVFRNANINSLYIPKNTNCGKAFAVGCSNLQNIEVDSNNKYYTSLNGVVYSKDMKELAMCPAGKTGALDIPETVTKVLSNACSGCTKLTSISIPNTVVRIEGCAFENCISVQSINIPNNETYKTIEFMTFKNIGVEEITIPKNITCIKRNNFGGKTKSIKFADTSKQWKLIFQEGDKVSDVPTEAFSVDNPSQNVSYFKKYAYYYWQQQ